MILLLCRGYVRLAIVVACLVQLQGCYYVQAARGQLEVLRKRESVAELINAEETPPALATRLRVVAEARRFSIDELGLPDNDSYMTYADLERDYVVWNVFAAPEFSLQPKVWCFPVAGCVGYRGYFAEDAAWRQAAKLAEQGFDVVVGGVPAYSTLGKFDDPVLNTMLRWDDSQLVATLFHELAHQVVYVKGDSEFNESFATAVEETGIERWLAWDGAEREISAYRERQDLRRELMRVVAAASRDLEHIYTAATDDPVRRGQKEQRLDQLATGIRRLFELFGRDASAWLENGLNNARLASMALYEARLPAFRALLQQCDGELRCFYEAAERLSRLDKEDRDRTLDALAFTLPEN